MSDGKLWDPPRRRPLDPAALSAAAGPAWRVEYAEAAPSTNALAADHPEAGLVVVVDHQTAGRGRLDRSWATPAHVSLTMSAVLEPDLPPERWPLLPLIAGVAVATAVGPRAKLKWPNDVLIDDQKVCGILVERPAAFPSYAVVGIGINVDQVRSELPLPTATSLRLAGLDVDRTELFGAIVAGLRDGLAELRSDPGAALQTYRTHSATLGRSVSVYLPDDRVVHGLACEIDDDGKLVVETPTERLVVGAGDVVHARLD